MQKRNLPARCREQTVLNFPPTDDVPQESRSGTWQQMPPVDRWEIFPSLPAATRRRPWLERQRGDLRHFDDSLQGKIEAGRGSAWAIPFQRVREQLRWWPATPLAAIPQLARG